jgi:NADP-dependent 3-hydroxy acid dehydrogenase YdfG
LARSVLYTTTTGDKQPSLPAIIKDAAGNVVNLTGYTSVSFALRQAYATANTFSAAGVIVTPASGTVRYDLGPTDLVSLVPGVYVGQWILFDATSKPQHVDAGEFEIRTGY